MEKENTADLYSNWFFFRSESGKNKPQEYTQNKGYEKDSKKILFENHADALGGASSVDDILDKQKSSDYEKSQLESIADKEGLAVVKDSAKKVYAQKSKTIRPER